MMFGVLQHDLLAASVPDNKISHKWMNAAEIWTHQLQSGDWDGDFHSIWRKGDAWILLTLFSEQWLKYWQHLLIKNNRQSEANRRVGKRLPQVLQQLAGRVKTSAHYQVFVLRWQPPVLYARGDRWDDKPSAPVAWWLSSVLFLLARGGLGWPSCLFQL